MQNRSRLQFDAIHSQVTATNGLSQLLMLVLLVCIAVNSANGQADNHRLSTDVTPIRVNDSFAGRVEVLNPSTETATMASPKTVKQDETVVPVPSPSIFGPFGSHWESFQKDHRTTGFIDFNSYWDTRNFTNTTVNLLANLPNDFQYFQLLNLDGAIDSGSHDLGLFFTEMNLRRVIAKNSQHFSHLDWTIQYADGSIPHGVLRFGCRCRVQDSPSAVGKFFKETLRLNYSINFHLVETDSNGWQIEHVYRRQFLDGKVYLAGFCDHNINNRGGDSAWVTEHQVGLQVFDSMYLVAEHRYNSFLPSGSRQGMGIGLEYVMRFR